MKIYVEIHIKKNTQILHVPKTAQVPVYTASVFGLSHEYEKKLFLTYEWVPETDILATNTYV